MLQNAQQYSHTLLADCVRPGDAVVDATAGNGHDTLYLTTLVGQTGHVYACDIQADALTNTRALLDTHHVTTPVTLIHDSHATLADYLTGPIRAAIFNLGYLPGSDRTQITRPSTTIPAIQALQERLTPGGRIIIVCYWGHDGGQQEKDALDAYMPTLPQKEWTCLRYEFLNQQHCPPVLYVVEKR